MGTISCRFPWRDQGIIGLQNNWRTVCCLTISRSNIGEVEMLCCNAGLSITSKAAAEQRTKAFDNFITAPSAKTSAKFDKLAAKGPNPSEFTSSSQVLPLCAVYTGTEVPWL